MRILIIGGAGYIGSINSNKQIIEIVENISGKKLKIKNEDLEIRRF